MFVTHKPETLTWRLYRGDESSFTIVMKDSEGNLVSLADQTFLAQIKAKATDATAIGDLSTTVGDLDDGAGSTVDAAIFVYLSPEVSALLPEVSVFDIQSTKSNGSVTTILTGTIYAEQDVSR